jgi:transglutaminase-like putative cysteine protease
MKRAEASGAATRAGTLVAIASFAMGVLLHIDRVPLWCAVIAVGAIGFRVAAEFRKVRVPGRIARALLALGVVLAVLGRFRTLNGLSAGTVLLMLMGSLKLFEIESRRDRLIVVAVALVLLLAACLDRQGLLRVPLYLAHLVLTCAALALVATPRPGFGLAQAARLAGRSLALASPLAIALFLFFPRIAGSFWALPANESAVTGLGETMSPGDISSLSQSDEPAFRVRFEGAPPPPRQRYWRGPVLHVFDGYTWRRERGLYFPQQPLGYRGPAYRYRVTLEPHDQSWLFALEQPAVPRESPFFFTSDYQLLAAQPVTEAFSYELTSFPEATAGGELPGRVRRLETDLPPGRNARSAALAFELKASAPTDRAFVANVLEYFRTQGFEYTLTPPKLDYDSIDDFLFNTRRGFCGHFASAFVTLMRAAGVPARVVTGYLGGEWNPMGRYLIVRQSDAHAWAEVWLSGQGWTRIDPTAVVAPERLNRGLFDFLPDAMNLQTRLVHDNPWLARLRLAWDAADTWWRDRVQHYDLRAQAALLARLGLGEAGVRALVAAVATAIGVWLLWIGWQLRRALHRERLDPVAAAYARLCANLARAGIRRAAHEGPIDFAARVARLRPELAAQVRSLCVAYAVLRFGRTDAHAMPTGAFARAVAAFRPS